MQMIVELVVYISFAMNKFWLIGWLIDWLIEMFRQYHMI